MSPLGILHLSFALLALGVGAIVVLLRKGTRWHRTFGHLYFTMMLGVNLTALWIFELTGTINVFHIFAIASLAFLVGGIVAVVARVPKRGWRELHASALSGSYIGLVAAAFAEIVSRVPGIHFAMGVALATFVVTGIGFWILAARLPRALGKFENNS